MSSVDNRRLLDRIVRPYPPRRYRADQYQRWFPKTGEAMRRYLDQFAPLGDDALGSADPTGEGTVGVVVAPWFSTPVPWYALMLGIGLARRGREVVVFWDDTGFPQRAVAEQNRQIGDVLEHLGHAIPAVRLSDGVGDHPRPGDADLIASLTAQNVTWTLRGAVPTERDQRMVGSISAALAGSLPLVRTALAHHDLDLLVVPGGVSGTSGLFLECARERGCRGATFDVDRGIAQICTSGVAAQNGDLARAFDALWNTGGDTRRRVIDAARAELTRRTEGRDRYGFQLVPSDADAPTGEIAAVIPMNVEWDSAALGRHVHFADTVDWLTTTIATVLEADAGTVVIRQHPSERRPQQRSRLDVAGILRERFGEDHRVRFVAAEDPTNTYDLLGAARLVLPFVSTIGIEAAAIGKPVVAAGKSWYADLGFVRSAGSRVEYLDLVRRGVRGQLPPLDQQCDRAWAAYYVTAVANRVWTDFTPSVDDFWKWCRVAPDTLFSQPEVADILEAIDRDVPVSLLRDRRIAGPQP